MRGSPYSLSTKILIGMGLGIACGLFFGEYSSWLGVVGDVYIKFLQMTVVPYVVVSLVLRIGGLDYQQARQLAVRGGLLLLVFWVLGVVIPLVGSLSMPNMEQGSFFSTSEVTPAQKIDFLDEYIPWNPFYSLANTVVPAVVLFSVFLGIALIGIGQKEEILKHLALLSQMLTRITDAVVAMTPYGVFAIAAHAAGTLTIKQFETLQVYLILYMILALLVTFLILPVIASTLTPFSYRDIVNVSKDALLTGFTTSSLFVVMPVISSGLRKMFHQYQHAREEELGASADIVIPIYYNLPDTGKLLSLIFVLFAAWYVGKPIPLAAYPYFGVTGFFSFLASVSLAIPYLLKTFQIQSNLFELFVASGVINARFSTLAATMDLLVFSLLCACAMTNTLRIQWKRIVPYWAAVAVIFLAVITATRIVFGFTVSHSSKELERLNSMDISPGLKAMVSEGPLPDRDAAFLQHGARLAEIVERGRIRVGYDPDSLPFAYRNQQGNVVGFDIAMAYKLAADLGVGLDLIEIPYEAFVDSLKQRKVDLIMSGTSVFVEALEGLTYGDPYMEMHLALVVKSYERDRFKTLKDLRKAEGLTVATLPAGPFRKVFQQAVPSARFVVVDAHQDFFEEKVRADALLISAEGGGPWTLRYPAFQVVVPRSIAYRASVAYPQLPGEQEFLNFLDQWVQIQKLNGFVDRQYDQWILGNEEETEAPRWSILNALLHWARG